MHIHIYTYMCVFVSHEQEYTNPRYSNDPQTLHINGK